MTPASEVPTCSRRGLLVLAAFASCGAMAAAKPPAGSLGVVTILDGDATALGDGTRVRASEGLRVGPGTIVETGPKTGLLHVDVADGSAIDLGPSTRVMLWPSGFGAHGADARAMYLLEGWAKLSSPTATIPGLVTPALDLRALKGVAVAFASAGRTMLFLESGDAQLVERYDGASQDTLPMKNTDFYVRFGAEAGHILANPTDEMLAHLPVAFRDTLPSRAALFQERTADARPLPPPTYEELRPWLNAEAALRKPFPHRFLDRAKDPAFRHGLVGEIAAHPEWRPVLFPRPVETVAKKSRSAAQEPEITVITRRPDDDQ